MDNKRMKNLAAEIFQTINNLNPSFMKEIFTAKILRPNGIL